MYKHQTYRLLQTINDLLRERTFKSHLAMYMSTHRLDTRHHRKVIVFNL